MAAEMTAAELLEMQTDNVPTSGNDNGSYDAAHQGSGGEGYVSAQLTDPLLRQLDTFMSEKYMPMAAGIQAEMDSLQYEAQAVDQQAVNDKQELDAELKRLTDCVLNFQDRIAQFLQLGSLQQR